MSILNRRLAALGCALLLLGSGCGCEVDPRPDPATCDATVHCPSGTDCNPTSGTCAPRSRPEPPLDVGRFCKVRLTPENQVLVASHSSDFGDLELLSAVDPNQPGVRTVVDGAPDDGRDPDVGQHVDLAVAEDGTLHLAYRDADEGALRYARRDERGWDIRVIDDEGDAGRWISIALDSQGWPRIAYAAGSTAAARQLRLARASPSGWSRETVDSGGVGLHASLVLTGEAERIAYYDELNGALKLAARGAGGFGAITVDDGVREIDDDGDGEIDRVIDLDVGRWASAATGPDGRIAIAYFDATRGHLLYARPDGNQTRIESVWAPTDGRVVGQFASLVFDHQNLARVVFQDSTNLDLYGAIRESDGSWKRRKLQKLKPDGSPGLDGPDGFWANQSPGAGRETLVCHYRPARSADGEARGSLQWLQWLP